MKVTDITRLAFPAVAWILPPALAVAVSPHGDHGLHSLIHARGKGYFGTATDPKYFNETEYINIISNRNEWGQITPENSLKACCSSSLRLHFRICYHFRLGS